MKSMQSLLNNVEYLQNIQEQVLKCVFYTIKIICHYYFINSTYNLTNWIPFVVVNQKNEIK